MSLGRSRNGYQNMPLRLLLGSLRENLPGGNCDTVVLFCVVCVRVPLLCVVRRASEVEPSGLGVSLGGHPRLALFICVV